MIGYEKKKMLKRIFIKILCLEFHYKMEKKRNLFYNFEIIDS